MSITCGYDAEAQDAVERGAERFPVFCPVCDQRIPFHSPRKQTRIRPDIAKRARQIDMRDAYMNDLESKAKAHMASLSKAEQKALILSVKVAQELAAEEQAYKLEASRP